MQKKKKKTLKIYLDTAKYNLNNEKRNQLIHERWKKPRRNYRRSKLAVAVGSETRFDGLEMVKVVRKFYLLMGL